MTRAERAEAAQVLKEIAYEIYDKLDEMAAILEEVAPEELELARVYWMAHIDRALFNRKQWRKVRFITLQDTITILEEV
jgi:hypothetical protein